MSVLFSAELEPKEGRAFRALVFKLNENACRQNSFNSKNWAARPNSNRALFQKARARFRNQRIRSKIIFDEDEKNLTR